MSRDSDAGVAFALTSILASPFMLVGGIITSPFVLASQAFSRDSYNYSSSGSHFGFFRGGHNSYGFNSPMSVYNMSYPSSRFGGF